MQSTLDSKYRKTTTNKPYRKCRYACSLKHLKSLYTFPEKSGQVPDESGQEVLADRGAAIYSVTCHYLFQFIGSLGR